MTDIVSGSASIQDLIERIGWYKGSPTRIQQATYDFIDELMGNKVDLVDPTNPFILLLECSSVHTALAVNECLINQRKSYVGLAQTDSDIYRHMTDTEYLGRFANPGVAKLTLMFELNSLRNAMVYDGEEDCYKAIIPRDTSHTVDNYTFTHEYPIVIRRYPNEAYQVSYDLTIPSPISTPSNNLIRFQGRRDSQGMSWLYFTIPVKQMKITVTSSFTIAANSVFRKDLPFDDQFVYARVFNKSTATGNQWRELRTTHSDQVFDNSIPTAVLKVTTGKLNVTIPYIYVTQNSISGSIRVDLYTTKGDVTVNMSSYTLDAYKTQFQAIDEIRDNNVFSLVWNKVTAFALSDAILTGGKNGISFAELKEKVVDYATGVNQIPITTAQADSVTSLDGFEIVRNADALTNRIFLGTRALPELRITDVKANTQKLISRSNFGMIRFSSDLLTLQSSDNVVNNTPRLTLLSNTVFSLNNGISELVETSTVNSIKAQAVNSLVGSVNSQQYVYTPYYYVFDPKDNILNVRPYNLDQPVATNLSFVRQNQTLAMAVSTNEYFIEKISGGYRVTITTISGKFYKDTNDAAVAVQLRFVNNSGSLSGTINGTLVGKDEETGERIYQFDIHTNYDIDDEHSLCIINAYNGSSIVEDFFVSLESSMDVLFTTTDVAQNYVADATDGLINKAKLPVGSVGNSHDRINFQLGQYLEHLWSRVRTFASGPVYQTSPVDVPLLYEKTIYKTNEETGSIIFFDGIDNSPNFHVLHNLGETVYNTDAVTNNVNLYGTGEPTNDIGIQGDYYIDRTNGDYYGPKGLVNWPNSPTQQLPPRYKYRAGQVILDNNGNPISLGTVGSKNEFDFFVLDGKLQFVTDPVYLEYRSQIIKLITGWIIEDMLEIQKRLIERTTILFYPLSTLGLTKIVLEDEQFAYLNSEQSLSVTVFADDTVINDETVKANITADIVSLLDTRLRDLKFTLNSIEEDLKRLIGKNVFGISIWGLGGDADYQHISISDEHNRLGLRKKLVAQSDNSITLTDDVDITFKLY